MDFLECWSEGNYQRSGGESDDSKGRSPESLDSGRNRNLTDSFEFQCNNGASIILAGLVGNYHRVGQRNFSFLFLFLGFWGTNEGINDIFTFFQFFGIIKEILAMLFI